MHKKFIECIEYAKRKGIKEVSTLTSGSKLFPEFTERMIQSGLDWITVSIDGVGDTYNNIRKPITFNEILERVKFIKEYKNRHGLHKPVVKVQGIWPAIKENPQLYYDTFAPYVNQVAFNPLIDYRTRDKDIVYQDEFTCPQHYQRLVIGADGLAMMCSNDEENKEVVGNAKEQSIHEIWHGEKLSAMRELHKKERGFMKVPVCRRCYLPRKTENKETAIVNGIGLIIKNYVNRKQAVGE